MRSFVVAIAVVLLAGCASWWSLWHGAPALLVRADALLAEGDTEGALRIYDQVLTEHPDDPAGARARVGRQLAAHLGAARAEIDRLTREARAGAAEVERLARDARALAREAAAGTAEVARLREALAAREGELGRLRQELTARQGDVARLSGEADRLREDLEQLKRIDLRLERRR